MRPRDIYVGWTKKEVTDALAKLGLKALAFRTPEYLETFLSPKSLHPVQCQNVYFTHQNGKVLIIRLARSIYYGDVE